VISVSLSHEGGRLRVAYLFNVQHTALFLDINQ